MKKKIEIVDAVICPNVDGCEYRSKSTEEEKQKHPDLYCPCERPHSRTKYCNDNKCCPGCVPTDKREEVEV